MKVGNMNLDNLPFGGETKGGDNSAMAQIGTKLVDALLQSGEMFRGSNQSGNGGGMTMKDMLEMMKLLRELEGGERQTAKDTGLGEMLKLLADSQRENTRLMLETLKRPEPKESDGDQFLKQLALQVIEGNMKSNPHESMKHQLSQLAELQQMFQHLSPQQQNDFEKQLALMDKKNSWDLRRLELELKKTTAEKEYELKKQDMDSNEDRLLQALGIGREFFSSRRRESSPEPMNRTAGPAQAPTAPPQQVALQRVRCDNCQEESLVPQGRQYKFCPNCGDPKVDRPNEVDPGMDEDDEEAPYADETTA